MATDLAGVSDRKRNTWLQVLSLPITQLPCEVLYSTKGKQIITINNKQIV